MHRGMWPRVVDDREPQRDGDRQATLTDYADTAAYVLIAEPGAGKTTAFETEAAKQVGGSGGCRRRPAADGGRSTAVERAIIGRLSRDSRQSPGARPGRGPESDPARRRRGLLEPSMIRA